MASEHNPDQEHHHREHEREHDHDHDAPRRESARAQPGVSPVAELQHRLGNAWLLQLRHRAIQRQSMEQQALAMAQQHAAERMAEAADMPEVQLGAGERLAGPLQRKMEQQHGVPMGDVEVVKNADAATDAVNALAFATQDGSTPKVALSSSVDLSTPGGQFTLAHELAHVAQQKRGQADGLQGLGGDEHHREHLENQADAEAAQSLKS